MKSVALDSSPTINIRIPSDVRFNVSPRYLGTKTRGQPLLGHRQAKYTHFVPMGDGASHIKKLLEIPESDTESMKPIEGYHQVLKAEREVNKEEQSVSDTKVIDSDFKHEASSYLASANFDREDAYSPKKESVQIPEKNNGGLVNIVSAAQSNTKKEKEKSHRAREKPKSNPRHPQKNQKKKARKTVKKMTSFKIISKKK